MSNIHQMDLFSEQVELRIDKISKDNVVRSDDIYKQFEELILQHEEMYPGIDRWLNKKVVPGIKSGERISYLGYRNNRPIVSSVVKKGKDAKFCHLHIDSDSRNNRFGDLFFSMMAVDLRHTANSVYFTLPESLWHNKRGFFNSFGFTDIRKSKIQYRKFQEELHTSTSHKILWQNMLEKLPRIISSLTPSNEDIFTGVLMSVRPEYIEKMESGQKIIEIRKRFNSKWNKCRITLYSTSPLKALYGHVKIDQIEKGHPDGIWSKYKSHIGCTQEEYEQYSGTAKEVYAIKLIDFQPYRSPLLIDQLQYLLKKDLKSPQAYLKLQNNPIWSEAVSIAELLHRRFNVYVSHI